LKRVFGQFRSCVHKKFLAQVIRTEAKTYTYSHRKEVIHLKFGDIVMAVASLTVLLILLIYPITLAFNQALSYEEASLIGGVIALILSATIVGYIFTQKIWEENRTRTIAKITVLFAFIVIFMSYMEWAATDYTPVVKENYLKANPTADPSPLDWYNIESMALTLEKFVMVVLVSPLVFIGLYIGSMLKKPAKSQK